MAVPGVGPDDIHDSAEAPRTCRLVMAIDLYTSEMPVFGWFARGKVANVSSRPGEELRVGVEFEDLTVLERDVLDAVVQITTHGLVDLDLSRHGVTAE